MPSGRLTKLAGQVAEHLVCAELGRRELIATPFAGNVPTFDIVAADERCRVVPIQVKATRSDNWPTDARTWMDLTLRAEDGVQQYHGPRKLVDPDLIYVCVVLQRPEARARDRFCVLTKEDVQKACIASYRAWMEPRGWRRPQNPASYDCRFAIDQIAQFEDNWELVRTRLGSPER